MLTTKEVRDLLRPEVNNEKFHLENVSQHFVDRVSERGLKIEEIVSVIGKSLRRNQGVIYHRFKDCQQADIHLFNTEIECVIKLRKGDRCPVNEYGEKLLLTFVTAYKFSRQRLNKLKTKKVCFT